MDDYGIRIHNSWLDRKSGFMLNRAIGRDRGIPRYLRSAGEVWGRRWWLLPAEDYELLVAHYYIRILSARSLDVGALRIIMYAALTACQECRTTYYSLQLGPGHQQPSADPAPRQPVIAYFRDYRQRSPSRNLIMCRYMVVASHFDRFLSACWLVGWLVIVWLCLEGGRRRKLGVVGAMSDLLTPSVVLRYAGVVLHSSISQ